MPNACTAACHPTRPLTAPARRRRVPTALLRTLMGLGLLLGSLATGASTPEPMRLTSLDDTPITAQVLRPAGAARGVVVALHGCGGLYAGPSGERLASRHLAMAELIVAQGWAAVLPDSFNPRGAREVCRQKISERGIRQAQRRADALGTLRWVQQQPEWASAAPGGKPLPVVLLGWSHGGSAVLESTDGRLPLPLGFTPRFAHAVAFYPGCSQALRRGYMPQAPLTLLIGGQDDWTPPGPCIELAQRSGAELQLYPEAHHGFDAPTGEVRHLRDVPNGVFPGQGVHAGRHEAARVDAWRRVAELLQHLAVPGTGADNRQP